MPNPVNRVRRTTLATGIFAAVLGVLAAPVLAQEFPVPGRPIRILNPFPPGGTSDVLSRAIAARLTQNLGVPVFVENKPGGSTIIAVNELRRAAPDGHTVLYTVTGTTSQLPHLYAKPPYDVFGDFTPLGLAAYNRLVLVAANGTPFNSVRELIEYAKANPGKVNYASFGNGSFPHILSELMNRAVGIQMVHIPFKGGADAGRAIMGGQVEVFFDVLLTGINNFRAGRVKMLAVASPTRLPLLPDTPTLVEAGLQGFDLPGLEQLLGPAGMPRELATRVNAEFMKAIRSPEVADIYLKNGFDLRTTGADEHAKIMKESYDSWGAVIRRTGIKLD